MMLLSIKQYLIGAALLLCCIVSSWLVLKTPATQITPLSGNNYPDSYSQNIKSIRMNEETGLPQDELHAAFAEHYRTDDRTVLTQPQVIIFENQGQTWHLSANHGQTKNGTSIIELWENVILHQPATQKNQPLTLSTSAVTIYPKQQFAQTHHPVTGEDPNVTMRAQGMRTYFKTGIIELLSQVQGSMQSHS